jgi:hypothetical protein
LPKQHIFGIDPGEVRTGFVWIVYDPETKIGDTKIMAIYSQDEFHDILKTVWGLTEASNEPLDIRFVVENFRVNSNDDPRKKTWFWDEVKTIRVIGAVELAAKWCGAKVSFQEPKDVLPMARKWAPFTMAKHPRDDHSAWCHAVHWMKRRGLINTPDQVTMYGQDKLA